MNVMKDFFIFISSCCYDDDGIGMWVIGNGRHSFSHIFKCWKEKF